MTNPLFKILWWVRVAALGLPVVPDVNWMLAESYTLANLGKWDNE